MRNYKQLIELPLTYLEKAAPKKLFWIGVPLALYSWTIFGPLISDDLHLILKSERYHRGEIPRLELYRIAATDQEWQELRDRGDVPWWTPSSGRLDFLRPVSEYLFYLDVLLFGRNSLCHRITGLLTLFLALLCVHRLFITASGDGARSGAATFFFGVSQTVTPPATWMCNRQDLFVIIGVTIAATEYWKLRTRPSASGITIGALAFLFALLSKEVAIALLPILLIFEFLARRRTELQTPARPRITLVAIILVLGTAYLLYYAKTRPWAFNPSGADGTSSQLAAGLPISLLLYASVWTLGYPIDVLNVARPYHVPALAAVGGTLMLICLYQLWKRYRRDPSVLFFALWSILFILPGLRSLTPSTRTLCTATVGWAYLVVTLLFTRTQDDAKAPLLLRSWLFTSNVYISIFCVIGTVIFMNTTENAACQRLGQSLQKLATPLQDGDALVFDRADSQFESICAGDRLEFISGRKDVSVHFLMAEDINADFAVEGNHSIVATAVDRSLFDSAIHGLALGPKWRPSVGKEFKTSLFDAQILKVTKPDRVDKIRFQFVPPLDSTRLHFDFAKPVSGLRSPGR